MGKKENGLKRRYWPELSSKEDTDKTLKHSFEIVIFITIITAIVSLFQVLGYTYFDFSIAIILAFLAFGFYKHSRVCAVTGFTLVSLALIANLAISFSQGGSYTSAGGTPYVTGGSILIFFAFINSVRGTFAHHKFIKDQALSTDETTKQGGVQYCTSCGKPSGLNNNYCIHCGNPLASI